MFNDYICALDLGSSKICASLAKIKKNRIDGLFFESTSSKGIEGGIITNSVEPVNSIDKLLKSLKKKTGINIKAVYINISGPDVIAKHSRAVLPLAEKGNKIITFSDIQKVNEQARILGSSLEEEIIHQIPFGYSIDTKSDISNPLGLYSHRLEVDLYLICAKVSSVQTLTQVINHAGYEVKELFFSGIAVSTAVFGKEIIKDGSSVLCDIGRDITELVIFKDGCLKNIEILPFGGGELSREISRELKVPFELAEEIKICHSSIGQGGFIKEDKEILIKKDKIYKPIKQKVVSQILTYKSEALCRAIKNKIEDTLPCENVKNFAVTGRSALLEGFLETLEKTLEIPVSIGRITNPHISALTNREEEISGPKYLNYITCLGMICEVRQRTEKNASGLNLSAQNIFLKTINKIREVYSEYF